MPTFVDGIQLWSLDRVAAQLGPLPSLAQYIYNRREYPSNSQSQHSLLTHAKWPRKKLSLRCAQQSMALPHGFAGLNAYR